MVWKKVAALCAAGFVFAAVPARAQSPVEPGAWSATPFLSVSFGGDGDTSLGLGGAFAYDWTRALGVEGELAYVFDLAGDTAVVDWSTLGGSVSVVYHYPLEQQTWIPYGRFGLGFVRSSIDLGDIGLPDELDLPTISSTELAIHYGGGVKIALTDRTHARVDLRYTNGLDDAPDGFRLYGGVGFRVR